MTFKELADFIASRPRYFEDDDGLVRIREPLADPIETYSRLTDPETYEDIQQRTTEAVVQRRRQIEQELTAIEESLKETIARLNRAEATHAGLLKRESEHARRQHVRPVSSPPQSRSSHLWAVLLDFTGAVFLYLGTLTSQGLSLNMILLGVFLIIFGFVWSASIGFSAPRPAAAPRSAAQSSASPVPRGRFRLLEAEIALHGMERSRLEREQLKLKNLLQRTDRVSAGSAPRNAP